MTTMPFALLALLAIPVVLLVATAGCGLDPIDIPESDAPQPAKKNPGEQKPPGNPILTPTPATPPTYSELVLGRKALIGYWRLGEPKAIFAAPNPKAVNSYTPNTLDANYVNTLGIALEQDGALSPKDPDKAASFGGAGGYVEVPYHPWLNPASLTVELWMRLDTAFLDWRVLVGCYEPLPFIDTFQRGYRVRARPVVKLDGSGAIEIEAHLGAMSTGLKAEIAIGAQPAWHHIALVYDAAAPVAQLFIDGAGPVKESQGSYLVAAETGRSLRFGAAQELLAPTYSGLLDEIALYGDCLSGNAIHEHFLAATT